MTPCGHELARSGGGSGGGFSPGGSGSARLADQRAARAAMLLVVALAALRRVSSNDGWCWLPLVEQVFGEAADCGAALGIDADEADRPGDRSRRW